MGTVVLVPIGPGIDGDLATIGSPSVAAGARSANDLAAEAAANGATHLVAIVHRSDAVDRPDPAGQQSAAAAAVAELGPKVGLSVAKGAIVTVNLAALLDIGGFDPDEPGLGWLDLVDRFDRSGWSLRGVRRAELPFVPALTAGLDPAERLISEGRWLARHATNRSGRRRLERHLRLVGETIDGLRLGGETDAESVPASGTPSETSALIDRVEAEARRRWRGVPPDEAQRGTGARADWRHLLAPLPVGQPRRLAVLIGLGPIDRWRWLVDDGWVEHIDDRVPADRSADVVVVGPGSASELRPQIPALAAVLRPGGSLCLMLARPGDSTRANRVAGLRAAGSHRGLVAELRRSGLPLVRRHLALPDASRAKRLVPLDHPGGLDWLTGPAPALAAASLPRGRRLVRALAGRVGSLAPELVGDVVLVATSPVGRVDDWGHAIVITSGFDEGSRTVLLPLSEALRPTAVIKVTARPAYRSNGEREHELLLDLAPKVEPKGLVPEPRGRIECDGLPAVVESYGGRWTATDILNEQPDPGRRVEILVAMLDAVTALNRTGATTERWNAEGFEDLIGRWFDALDEIDGRSPARMALRESLAIRSRHFDGVAVPVGLRHFDLGPWNIVMADAAPRPIPGVELGGPRALMTVVDWELAPPRDVARGPIGADQLYLSKYWLHIAMGCRSVDEEQSAFAFLADPNQVESDEPRSSAKRAMVAVAADIGLPVDFLPLLEAHVWAEAAAYTATRRRGRGGDGGSPARYLATLARRRVELLDGWA